MQQYSKIIGLILVLVGVQGLCASTQAKTPGFAWPKGEKAAVSLSYDDALDSQLDNALPTLNRYHFKASFYLTLSSTSLQNRLPEWRAAAMQGHELGNHTIFHACRKSLPNRDWVKPFHDLDQKPVAYMEEEIRTANTFLQAIDGRRERTITLPCGDGVGTGGESFVPAIADLFVAIKGQELQAGFSSLLAPSDVSGKQLIEHIESETGKTQLINIVFHGVGGDYLMVSKQAHDELLEYLADNHDNYWVDSYVNIMNYVSRNRAP